MAGKFVTEYLPHIFAAILVIQATRKNTKMRNTNEQLEEILKRSDIIREKRKVKKHMFIEATVSVFCLVLIVVSVYKIPGSYGTAGEMSVNYGSLILRGEFMGMIIVGLLAFLLGVTVTLLCLHYKQYKSKDSEGDGR